MPTIHRNAKIQVFLFIFAIILTYVAIAVAGQSGQSTINRVFLTNRAQSAYAVTGICSGSDVIIVTQNEIKSMQCADPTHFQFNIGDRAPVSVDVTDEGNFSFVTGLVDECLEVKGTFETVNGLIPSVRDYYMYVWFIRECAK